MFTEHLDFGENVEYRLVPNTCFLLHKRADLPQLLKVSAMEGEHFK